MLPYADENPAPGRHEEAILLVAALAAIHLLGPGAGGARSLGFVPELAFEPGQAYRWLTSQFLHAGWMHLIGNLWALWIFADNVAARLGRWFFPFYLAGGAAANWLQWAMGPGSTVPAIGASGAICAVIGLYVVLFPRARLRCFMPFGLYLLGTYSLSALLYGGIYVGLQFLGMSLQRPGGGGVAYAAHLGGLFFGALVGLGMRGAPAEAIRLSGAAGESPSSEGAEGVMAALERGDAAAAARAFVHEARRDPYLELPAAHQLALADALVSHGHPQLAKAALDRFLLRHPADGSAPHALLLRGWVSQSALKDFGAAAEDYEAAGAHAAASEDLRAEAGARLAEARRMLESSAWGPAEAGRLSLLLETRAPLGPRQLRLVSALAGAAAGEAAAGGRGVLLDRAEAAAAGEAARGLEAAGIPVVLLPERLAVTLPAPRAVEDFSGEHGALSLSLPGGKTVTLAWGELLLLAVVGLPLGGLARKERGLLDVGGEFLTRRRTPWGRRTYGRTRLDPPAEYEGTPRNIPCLEVLGGSPLGRWRWCVPDDPSAPEACDSRFFAKVQGLLVDASGVPLDAGALEALHGRLSPAGRFETLDEAEAYLSWQAQLARLKKDGP